MAAGLGFKDFTTGEVLTAADVDGYLMQGIWVFANATARDAAVTSPQEGNFAFTKDNNSLWYYDGAAWVASGATGDIEGVTAGTGISGGGTSGTVTITNSMATAIDAKGDLVAGTGADTFARLAVGSDNQVLTADSSTATGLKWAAAGGGAYTLLSTTSLSGTTTSITGISTAYTDLMFIFNNPVLNTGNNFRINPNGLQGISYNVALIGSSQQAVDQMQLGSSLVPTSSNPNNAFCGIIYQYSQTTYGKPFTFFGGVTNQNTSRISAGYIGEAGAITQLDFTTQGGTASWTGGQVLIYGVK